MYNYDNCTRASANFINSVLYLTTIISVHPIMQEIRMFKQKTDGEGLTYKKFGLYLLESDNNGTNIESSNRGQVEDIVDETL